MNNVTHLGEQPKIPGTYYITLPSVRFIRSMPAYFDGQGWDWGVIDDYAARWMLGRKDVHWHMAEETMAERVGLGSMVRFCPKVFEAPYEPHFDAYKGHTFEVIRQHKGDHLEIVCVDDQTLIVQGYVHRDELQRI